MGRVRLKNRWIVVTGASGGLGKEIARCLAEREQANVVIAARREQKLLALKEELEKNHPVRVEVVAVDLAEEEGVRRLFREAVEIGPIYGLVNNAGLTNYGITHQRNLEKYEKIMSLNFSAGMELSLMFLSYFREKGEGRILNITSEAAFTPTPYQAVYSASKHALQGFTEALRAENRRANVVICTFAPGGIATDMISNSGLDKRIARDSFVNMKPRRAAGKAVTALKRGKALSIPGFLNKLNHFLMWLLPRCWTAMMAEKLYRPPDSTPDGEPARES